MSGCVIWRGYVDAANGYGLLYVGGREFKAHRAFYMAYKGPIQRRSYWQSEGEAA